MKRKECANILSQCGQKEFFQKLTFLENVLKGWKDGESVIISKDPVGPFQCDIENVAAHVDVNIDGNVAEKFLKNISQMKLFVQKYLLNRIR